MKSPLTIYWARRDFRIHDNPALSGAADHSKKEGCPLLPLFILEPYMSEGVEFGYSSQYMIAKAVLHFANKFKKFAVVHHKAAAYLTKLADTYSVHIFVNEDVHPDFYKQIKKIQESGVQVTVLNDRLTVPKDTKTGTGNLYSVFTPFKNAVWDTFIESKPIKSVDPASLTYIDQSSFDKLTHLISAEKISEHMKWNKSVKLRGHTFDIPEIPNLSNWYTTEDEALNNFKTFLKSGGIASYKEKRDALNTDGTSKMSTALAWGLISARTLVHEIQKHFDNSFKTSDAESYDEGAVCYISELIWREFYAYLLFHNPNLLDTEFQKKFRGTIQWSAPKIAKERFEAWIKGETGYPVVDAAMKQLAKTGWMHNRARMIVASVLTKNFGVDWRWGQEYFRHVLIDIDEASNNGGWQWGASVGADPKPIRIFNAELQAKTHDADGAYQNKWLGSDGFMQRPEIKPIIEHKVAREEALRRYGLSHVKPRDF